MTEPKSDPPSPDPPLPVHRQLRSSAQGRSRLTTWLLRIALQSGEGRSGLEPASEAAAIDLPSDDGIVVADLPALAEGHGLACLVAPRLSRILAEPERRALHDAAARCRARDARLHRDQTALDAAIAARGLTHLWLKGAWLVGACYPPPACRPRADLDLLVPAGDLPAMADLLHTLGYRPTSQTWKHQVWLRPDNRSVVDLRGEHPDNPRPVELHGRLVEAFRGISLVLDADAALARGADALAGPCRALGMVHLCAHLTVDMLSRRARGMQLVDLARLAPRLDAEDWKRVCELGGGRHSARFVWPALALAARHAPAALPAGVLDELAGALRPELRAWLETVDLDALSRFGRKDRRRALLEVPSIWPIDGSERRRVWRAILWPGRWELADRYPSLSASRLWRLAQLRHLGFSARTLARRWRLRPGRST